jgi:hypothetical protein
MSQVDCLNSDRKRDNADQMTLFNWRGGGCGGRVGQGRRPLFHRF